MKVFIDKDGSLINVGEWDFCVEHGENGEMTITNPIPDGAKEVDAEVTYTSSGRAMLSDDYYNLRQCEYPSIGDQLDALFKAGVFPEDMASKLQEIKNRYPKISQAK